MNIRMLNNGIQSFRDGIVSALPNRVTSLDLSRNHIKSLCGGDRLPAKLASLSLDETDIETFEGADSLPAGLKHIGLGMCKIKSFVGCDKLPRGLESICLEANYLTSFEGCEGLPHGLKSLCVSYNYIETFVGCDKLPRGLNMLAVRQNIKQSLEGCEGLPRGLCTMDRLYTIKWTESQRRLLKSYPPSNTDLLGWIKFLQRHYYDIEPILCQIRGNPYLDNTKTLLEEQGRLFMEDPDALLEKILQYNPSDF